MADANPTPEVLRANFAYNPETGEIFRTTGERPGRVGHDGGATYLQVCFGKKTLLAHRLAWVLMTGQWPRGQIDHINGDKADNRWANLRDVTPMENSQNMHRAKRNNRAGTLNVSKYRSGKFIARLYRNGRSTYLGSFDTPEEATAVVQAAKNLPSLLTNDLDQRET